MLMASMALGTATVAFADDDDDDDDWKEWRHEQHKRHKKHKKHMKKLYKERRKARKHYEKDREKALRRMVRHAARVRLLQIAVHEGVKHDVRRVVRAIPRKVGGGALVGSVAIAGEKHGKRFVRDCVQQLPEILLLRKDF